MRTREGKLLYTPSCTFEDLKKAIDNGDKEKIIRMFKERVEELYLKPAKLLIEKAEDTGESKADRNKNMGFVFSAGLICVSVIDFLGRYYMGCPKKDVRCRFICWLLSYMRPPFNKYLANKFYKDFRNGLVHECRIKNGGEFSLNEEVVIKKSDGFLIVNPKKLLDEIQRAFDKKYIAELEKNDALFEEFKNCLKNEFEDDFKKR